MKYYENMCPAPKSRFRWTKRVRSASVELIKRLETKSKSWSGPKTPTLPKASKASKPPKHPKIQKVIFAKQQETKRKSSSNAKIQKVIFAKRPETKSKSWHNLMKFHDILFKPNDFYEKCIIFVWKYVPGSQSTIQMNEAFPRRPVHLRTGTRDKEQKFIGPENTQKSRRPQKLRNLISIRRSRKSSSPNDRRPTAKAH